MKVRDIKPGQVRIKNGKFQGILVLVTDLGKRYVNTKPCDTAAEAKSHLRMAVINLRKRHGLLEKR